MTQTRALPLRPPSTSPPPATPAGHLRLPSIDDAAVPSYALARHTLRAVLACIAAMLAAGLSAAALLEMNLTVDAEGVMEQHEVWPVRALQSGLVRAILVATGDSVRRGQVVAALDSMESVDALRSTRDRLRAGQQEARRAAEALPLNGRIGAEKVREADARILRARATLREGLVELSMSGNVDSVLRAYVPGTSTRVDLALADVQTAEAGMRSAQAALEALRLDSMDLAGRWMELDRLAGDLAHAATRAERISIHAPADGVVLTDQLQRLVGSQVQAGDQLIEIADAAGWRAVVQIPERDVHDVQVGQAAAVEIPSLKRLDGRRLRGRVESVAPQPEAAGGGSVAGTAPASYRAVIALEAAQLDSLGLQHLRRGYTVRGKIVTRHDRIVVLALAYFRDRLNRLR